MSAPDPGEEMRQVAREILRELIPNGHGPAPRTSERASDGAVVPQVPAPPVAAVLRPSTWNRPAAPGEIIGSPPATASHEPNSRGERLRTAFKDTDFRPAAPAAASASAEVRVEVVAIATDEDLAQFIRRLMSRLENPGERLALRTGRLQFKLGPSAASATTGAGHQSGPVTRVEKGAVTERVIRAAAAEGARLVLGPGAVLTPLAREQARARGVPIERERRC